MKKVILTFITAVTALSLQAQNINPTGDYVDHNDAPPGSHCCANCDLSGWVIDVNLMGGALNQQYSHNSLAANYLNPVTANTNISDLNFNMGMSYGLEAQGGYFFGKKRHWGVGLGLMYMYQQGNVTLDNFHVEYQSVDNFGNTFRQLLTADNPIKESLRISSYNIPIVAKYQTKFSEKVGFTADAGLLLNLHVQNNYTTNAAFDYEAIYQYAEGGATVYDNSPNPASSDLLITKAQYVSTNTAGNIQNYFNTLKGDGYNVGLNQQPTNNKGSVTYTSGSLGFLLRPAVSIYVCRNTALNIGLYYYYQNLNNTPSSNYRLTDRIGEYSSVLNTVTNATNSSYGITFGVRYTFCKKATCAPPVAEIAPEPEPTSTPEPVAPPAQTEEAPETPHVDISTPLLFDLNKIIIKPSSIPILEEAVRELKANPDAKLTINGYTDNTGSKDYNKKLSKKRAQVVKNYLKKKGVNPKILKAVGHGEGHPADSNKTKEGRMRNRRVILTKDEE